MSWKTSHRARESPGALETLERQQAIVLGQLQAAAGRPVTYEQLRDAGVEFPASVVSELELSGVEVERCHERGRGSGGVVGVRMYGGPALEPQAVGPSAGSAHVIAASLRAWLAPARSSNWLARAIFLAAPALGLVLVVVALAAGGPGGASPVAASRPHDAHAVAALAAVRQARGGAHPSPASSGRTRSQSPSQPQPQPQLQPTPVSATLAAHLEAEGHELLQAQHYASAIAVLKRAIAATGESLGRCLQPASEPCLTYAYALYDLGRALLLSGSPAAAVGVLEHRLQIENQQSVVAAELESARRRLG